ncbi:MAG: hypothetical protein KF782_34765 [Labilithrix sp.]|nr:hypothetical protein [Labilithrix sp.]
MTMMISYVGGVEQRQRAANYSIAQESVLRLHPHASVESHGDDAVPVRTAIWRVDGRVVATAHYSGTARDADMCMARLAGRAKGG